VARIAAAPELQVGLAQVAQMAIELDSIDRRPPSFQRSALAQAAVPRLREARLDLLQSVGDRLRARIAVERSELRELLGQALRLDFEIAGREKELAAQPSDQGAIVQRRKRPQVDEDEELWPFQGEYWRDELGSYRFQLGKRCARPAAAPPHQVEAPRPVAPKVGAAVP
jgi:hypothetical protein